VKKKKKPRNERIAESERLYSGERSQERKRRKKINFL
jgi:hypothetical protein